MTIEAVLQEAWTWPLQERLQLATMLIQQAQAALPASAAQPPKQQTQAERAALIDEICGKYAGSAPSTEQFLAWKREEIELEEQRYERLFGNQTGQTGQTERAG